MPFFDIEQVLGLAGSHTQADSELDLGDLTAAEALDLLAREIGVRRRHQKSLIIRFRPATPDSGETLFQPVGRYLLGEKRAGRLSRVAQLLELGTGFYVEY